MSSPLCVINTPTEGRPLSVSQLTAQLRNTVESRFSSVWVEGEIFDFKPHHSGHWYFKLIDDGAQLKACCFKGTNSRLRFRPTNGQLVRAWGRVSIYAKNGEYNLIVD